VRWWFSWGQEEVILFRFQLRVDEVGPHLLLQYLRQSEEPSKLVTKLPVLASARGGDAAVVAGDRLAQLEPSMSSLSSSAAVWWRQLMDRVKGLYTTWLESAPVGRLSLRQSVLSQRWAEERQQRVEQRAAVLLLESLPEELRHEVVSVRAVTVEAMIFLVHCAFQPGGAGEKAHLLQFLTAPEVGSGLDGTLQLARKWVRLLRRGRELQLVLPDPSLLCRGLDRVISSTFSGNKHPAASFRIASFKLERQLDYKVTLLDAEDYAYLVVGELEAALLAQPLPAPPKIARMEEAKYGDEAGKGKGKAKQQRWKGQRRKQEAVRKAEEETTTDGAPNATSSSTTGSQEDSTAQTEFFEAVATSDLFWREGLGGLRRYDFDEDGVAPRDRGGTLLTTRRTAPIVAMRPLRVRVVNGCPEISEGLGLELIQEAEEVKGDKVPWNRHERKRWKQASAVAVHLFCGKDRAAWAARAEAVHVVLVDQAEDLMADGTYAALLDLALTGKIKMVFGGPPCRTFSALRNLVTEGQDAPRPLRDREGDGRWGRSGLSDWEEWRIRQDVIMIFRMLFLWMVAAAVARLNGDRDPDFLLEHPEDPKIVLGQPDYASLWAFPEIEFLGHGFSKVPAGAVEFVDLPPSRRRREIMLGRALGCLGGSVLESVMKMDHTFLEHLRSFRGHAHRPKPWCLSLDVVGPTRNGCDEYVKKIRYALIGTLVVPHVLGKLLQPPDPGTDNGGGIGPMDESDPVCEDGCGADEEVGLAAPVEEERSKREMERWQARVDEDKLDGVACVEVPFVVTMASKTAAEVLAATKDILVQVKKLGLVVQRVHTNRGREFICKGFRALCRDRGVVRTTTPGDDFKANGRVEALVGRAKNAVRTYLAGSGMGPEMWGFAMRHYVSKIQQEIVTSSWRRWWLPRFFAPLWMWPGARGFLVRADDGTYLTTMVAVENVKEVSGEFRGCLQQADDDHGLRRACGEEEEALLQDEKLAKEFSEAGDFSMRAADELLEGLRLGDVYTPNRRPGLDEGDCQKVAIHVFGMYRHGGVVGTTLGARRHPLLARFLAEVVKANAPSGTTFTTMSLNFNTTMRLHRDGNNQAGEKAYLMGFGNYVGGSLWCHEDASPSTSMWKKFNGKWQVAVWSLINLRGEVCVWRWRQKGQMKYQFLFRVFRPKGEMIRSRGSTRPWNLIEFVAEMVRSQGGPEEFFIGDDSADEEKESQWSDEWIRESWGAYGPPQVSCLKAMNELDASSYQIVGSEVPLEVGWDLFDEFFDFGAGSRRERGPLSQRVDTRLELERIMKDFVPEDGAGGCEHLFKTESVPEESEVPLHTKTISNEVVRKEIGKWVPSMLSEYESLIRENEAVEPFAEETLEQWKREGKDFDLVPGKTVHTVKAFTGRLKTRAVICGNFLGQTFSKDQKYAAGADGVLIRVVLRMVALIAWALCVMDVRTAFLLAPSLPGDNLAGDAGIYGVVDGSLWYVLVGDRRAGAIVCYVEDLLIAGHFFNGFEIARSDQGMILKQDSYTKDLLARYKDLVGYEDVPAPVQLSPEDFVIKESEVAADFVRAAQTMAGELQWLAERCRPEILYAVNLLSHVISKNPKEAVYRGGHLLKYLKCYPEGGIYYPSDPLLTPDTRLQSSGVVIEGFRDASFAPNSGRSQQAIMFFMMGGLVAWTSSRQAFVTMSTAESELVAICELVTCLKSVEHLIAEVMLKDKSKVNDVIKAIHSDSQAALAVCRTAAGSWRTRHLRIRGSLIRELLEQADWTAHHVDGRVMLADLGTKALSADRFGFLAERMRVVRKRCPDTKSSATRPEPVKKLLLLLWLASLVEQANGASTSEHEAPNSFDYQFLLVCV
ncbi:RE1, partial [Symbiodinium necroappetens]